MRYFIGAILLFALWLLMSGVYKPVTISLGAASCIFAVLVVRRMNILDGHILEYRLNPLRFAGYMMYLLKEIALSNLAVTRLILAPAERAKSKYITVPFSQKTELGETIFANSITLTPGTLTVEVDKDIFAVHALNFDDGTVADLSDMDARVCRAEGV